MSAVNNHEQISRCSQPWDSVSVINTATNKVLFEYDLRPYKTTPATGSGVAGGERIYSVAFMGNNTIYATSLRDREVDVFSFTGASPIQVNVTGTVSVAALGTTASSGYTEGEAISGQFVIDSVAGIVSSATLGTLSAAADSGDSQIAALSSKPPNSAAK
jgi:hypothetical protein